MAKKKNKNVQVKKSSYKKILISVIIAMVVAALGIVIVLCSIGPDIDFEQAKVNLKKAEYKISDYVPKAKAYVGVVDQLSATFSLSSSDSLSDYVSGDVEEINFICFDTEENAENAFDDFEAKWSDTYEECGLNGKIIYFGTSNALNVAVTTE